MPLTIELPPDLERRLREETTRSGQDVKTFVLDAVREKMLRAVTVAAVCGPFARAVEACGMGDEEFDQFFEQVRDEVWQAKQNDRP